MRVMIVRGCYLLGIVLCVLSEPIAASYCYPDYCQNVTELVPIPGFQCLLTQVQKGEGCMNQKFEDINETQSSTQKDTAIFTLDAYVKRWSTQEKTTAFNLSVTDINFHSLTTRYQHIVEKNSNACRHVKLYGNTSHPAPRELYVSCPFSDARYEGSPYRLEYLVTGDNYVYNGKYTFYVPHHRYIEDGVAVELYTPFVYVDVSDTSNMILHIQPLPPRYNVTLYRAWLIRKGTELAIGTVVLANDSKGHIRYNFTAPDGEYYVKVAALHPDCGEYGCVNSTTPYIRIRQGSDRLLIMIISTVWIPPVMLYGLYHIFMLYRKRVLKCVFRGPNCLLVYSPTTFAHMAVIDQLTKYLLLCDIKVMIDAFGIRDIASGKSETWCEWVFEKADVVLVVTSPPSASPSDVVVNGNVDKQLLGLLKENYRRRNKRYYAIHLPYCKWDDLAEEVRPFRLGRFRLPKDLRKLVRTIHGIGCFRFRWPSDKELLDSIKIATLDTEDRGRSNTEEINKPAESSVASDSPASNTAQETANHNAGSSVENKTSDEPVPTWYRTNIHELDLLGENREREPFFNPAHLLWNDRLNRLQGGCYDIDKLDL